MNFNRIIIIATWHTDSQFKISSCDLCLSNQWMEQFWRSDSRYASHGVDGSLCSFITYLSEVSEELSVIHQMYVLCFGLQKVRVGHLVM